MHMQHHHRSPPIYARPVRVSNAPGRSGSLTSAALRDDVRRGLSGLAADWGEIVGNIATAAGNITAAKVHKSEISAQADANREAAAQRLEFLNAQTAAQERLMVLQQQASAWMKNPVVLGGAAVALAGTFYFMRRRKRR